MRGMSCDLFLNVRRRIFTREQSIPQATALLDRSGNPGEKMPHLEERSALRVVVVDDNYDANAALSRLLNIPAYLPQTATQGQMLTFPITWSQLRGLGLVDNGPYLMTLRVTDTASESGEATVILIINNTAPTLLLAGATSVDEGQPYTVKLSASDPGGDTIRQWDICWGDGTHEIVLSNPDSVMHTYAVPAATKSRRPPPTKTVSMRQAIGCL
jgi:hypothetical protein